MRKVCAGQRAPINTSPPRDKLSDVADRAAEAQGPAGDSGTPSLITKASPSYRPFGAYRLFLAIVVVLGHSLFLTESGLRIVEALDPGSLAVFGFFVLSGYVIAEANDRFYAGRTGSFLINRGLRILPPYYAALIVSILLHLLLSAAGGFRTYDAIQPTDVFDAGNITGNLLVIAVWNGLNKIGLSPDYYFVRYIWAVIVELKFYCVAGAIYYLWFSSRLRGRRWAVGCALLGLVALHAAGWVSGSGLLREFDFVPLFMLGVFLYYALELRSVWWGFAAVAAFVASEFSVLRYVSRLAPEYDAVGVAATFSLVCATILILSAVRPTAGAIRIDRWLGDLTYPLYLNHYAVVVIFATLWPNSGFAGVWGCLGASIAVSLLISRLTDPPTKRLRDAIRGVRLA